MSRMTILRGELWLGAGGPDGALLRFGKSPEAGYPPYNIELLASGEGGPEALRITLAVAGFRLDELAITIEDGQLVVSGQQIEEHNSRVRTVGIVGGSKKAMTQRAPAPARATVSDAE